MALPRLSSQGGQGSLKGRLASSSFPVASSSYDWILRDSRAKASHSGEDQLRKQT